MDASGIEGQSWADEHPPRTLGRYELLGMLGTGGMATVYLARTAGEAGFQRLFAIKLLHPHLLGEHGFLDMFLDEARIAARLHHPNVVPIVDLAVAQGTHYVAMEYIEGCSLSALLKKHATERPPRLLIPIMLDALAGLDAAHCLTDDAGHSMNLVHRDVSPQNVLVGIDGAARITDFGIARAEARISGTSPGQLKGKIAYMSPEQIKGVTPDRRSDIFSAGAMMWSMLTGRRLFHGENDAATMNAILHLEIPPPSTIGFKPPPELDAICLRALERDPAKRYATAGDMEEELREAAVKAKCLGSRREVAAWVTETFHGELEARKTGIRTSAQRATGAPFPAVMGRPTAEFPSFTPSMATNAPSHEPAEETKEISVTPLSAAGGRARTSAPAPAKRLPRVAVIVAIPALCIAGLLAWSLTRKESTSTAEPPAAAKTELPVVATPQPQQAGQTYLDEAERLLADGHVDAARELIERTRALQSTDPDLHVRLAKIANDARLQPVAAKEPVKEPTPAAVAHATTQRPAPKRGGTARKQGTASPSIAETPTPPPAPAPAAPPPAVTPPAPPPTTTASSAPVAPLPPAKPAAPPVTAPPAQPASTEIATPRLPVVYSARSMKELSKVLNVIEGEAIDRGNVPAAIRGVTNGIAEEAFAAFAPGQLIELHPRTIYFAIVRASRAGKSPSAISASLRSAYQHGQL